MVFEIIDTKKLGDNWLQQFAVIRNNVVYLRVVGDGEVYRVMTATTGDDVRGSHLCKDKNRLWDAASKLAKTHKLPGDFFNDRKGRKYVRIFDIHQEHGETDEVFTQFFMEKICAFFKIYDSFDIDTSS